MTIYHFPDTSTELKIEAIETNGPSLRTDKAPKQELNYLNRKPNLLNKLVAVDYNKIDMLTLSIKETIEIYNSLINLTDVLPQEIKVVFSDKYKFQQKLNQFKNKFTTRTNFGSAHYKAVPEIVIPTIIFESFDHKNTEHDNTFLGVLRDKITPAFVSELNRNTTENLCNKVNSVICDLIFSHELAHIISYNQHKESLFHKLQNTTSSKKDAISPMKQLITSISEGFADLLGTQLVHIKSPLISVAERYSAVRNDMLPEDKHFNQYMIYPYNTVHLLKEVNMVTIDEGVSINSNMKKAISNSIKLSLGKIKSSNKIAESFLKEYNLIFEDSNNKSAEEALLKLERNLTDDFPTSYLHKEKVSERILSIREALKPKVKNETILKLK